MGQPLNRTINGAQVRVYPNKPAMGAGAAGYAAGLLIQTIREQGSARIVISTGNSQLEFIEALTRTPGIDWSKITALHLDEYVGLSATHPASFRRWIRERVEQTAHPAEMHYVEADAANIAAECVRYGRLLEESPIDIGFLGIGENGHIAFNDPPVADFADPVPVKQVELDERCRLQQVGEGHFPNLAAVPQYAITVTCSAIMRFRKIVCSVPELRKAEAVRGSLEGPVSTACPGSILRTHPDAVIFLDSESASLLS